MEQILFTIGSILFSVFIWEHVARKNSVTFRPSSIINYITDQFVAVFYWIGNKFAWLSSFYDWIEFGELIRTAHILWRSVWLLVTTPLELCKGYYDQLKTLSYPVLGVFGTLTLVILPLLILGPPSFVYQLWNWILTDELVQKWAAALMVVFALVSTVWVLCSLNFDIDGKFPIEREVEPRTTRTPTTPRSHRRDF